MKEIKEMHVSFMTARESDEMTLKRITLLSIKLIIFLLRDCIQFPLFNVKKIRIVI